MSLLDPSFHDFNINTWIDNLEKLPEPEYLLRSMDELVMSVDSEELRALLRKDDPDLSTYDKIMNTLKDSSVEFLYTWCLKPELFILDSGINVDDSRYLKFLSELIPGYVIYRNQWDRKQFGSELRNFFMNREQPHNRAGVRIKRCHSCGYNLSDLFASYLTADNIIDGTPVSVICPHCNIQNFIKY